MLVLVSIIGSEIVGLVPMEALIDTASYYLGLENFSMLFIQLIR